jgi:hypothetical protein
MFAGCSESDAPDDEVDRLRPPEIARIVSAEEALTGIQVSTLDPATMNDAEIRNALGTGPQCAFRYTIAGRPVIAASMQPNELPSGGMIKLNGNMVALSPTSSDDAGGPSGTFLLVAGPIRITVTPDREREEGRDVVLRREANLVFEVGQSLKVGYRGYLDCASQPPMRSRRH